MEPTIEIGKFPDGRLKMIMRFRPSRNYWVMTGEAEEATWCTEETMKPTMP